MKTRLYCTHCEKYYDVPLKDVRMLQEAKSESITYAHNTYYYDDDCFFKSVAAMKRDLLNREVIV